MLSFGRDRASALAIGLASCMRSWAYYRQGELRDAIADAGAAIQIATQLGFEAGAHWARASLVDALTAAGELERAEELITELGAGFDWERAERGKLLLASRGRLRLAQGRTEGGVDDLLACGRSIEFGDHPALVPWRADAVAGLVRLGERAEAAALADQELELARAFAAPRALATALRARALLDDGTRRIERLREALAVVKDSPAGLARADVLVDLGAAMRRANQRAAAREPLRRGLDLARHAGAASLVERAYQELRASGARPRTRSFSGVESLTASELRIVRMAAEEMTNREIAQHLFLTLRTVEMHLSNAYRKLEISSRRELASALASSGAEARTRGSRAH